MSTWRKFGAFLLTMILCVSVMFIPAFAEGSTAKQDGIEVTLNTDKEEYNQGDAIKVTLSVENTNDFVVSNVKLQSISPNSYQVSTKEIGTLAAKEKKENIEIEIEYVSNTSNIGQEQNPSIGQNQGTGGEESNSNIGESQNTTTSQEQDTNEGQGSNKANNSTSVNGQADNNVGNINDITSIQQTETDTNTISGNATDTIISNADNTEVTGGISSPKTGDDNGIFLKVLLILASAVIIAMIALKNKISKGLWSILPGVLIIGVAAIGMSVNVKADENNDNQRSISVYKNIMVNNENVELGVKVYYDYSVEDDNSSNDTGYLEVDLGEDVVPNLDYTPEVATPTFETKEDEIIKIAELNDGSTPYIESDDNGSPNYIDGNFSEQKVNSADDAISALNDIHYIMGFENAEQEFEEVYSDSVSLLGETTNFYRLQQTYHNIPVYGYQLIISTDETGEIQSLTGHYYPDIDIEVNPTVSMDEAKSIVSGIESTSNNVSDGLYIYVEDDSSAKLCWKIRTLLYSYFIDAENGNIISSTSELIDYADMGYGTSLADNNGITEAVSFPVNYSNGSYALQDDIRNIIITDAGYQNSSGTLITENSNNNWNLHKEAITSYSNIIKIYDYYASVLGRNGADGLHKQIRVAVNFRNNADLDSNGQYSNAAFLRSIDEYTFILVGDGNNFAKPLDVLAHEFTHAVTHKIWTGTYKNETGALNEAYSDIIGNLIADRKLDVIGEDLTDQDLTRSFSNPESHGQPSHYSNYYKGSDDNGGVHTNSGIINHAAYLMDQRWPELDHADELATLFYKSMYYLTPNSNFLDCRYAVLTAAKSMNMSSTKKNIINAAFDDVGVKNNNTAGLFHVVGLVRDAITGQPIKNAQVTAVATLGIGGGLGYSNTAGKYDIKVRMGIYRVSIFAEGYQSYVFSESSNLDSDIQSIYMQTAWLTPIGLSDNISGYASGKITNALTGEAIEGVTIKFRNNSNNQSGEYVQIVDGLDLTLQTDSDGQYYTAALPAGNYTLEASKDGFVTGYANIISGVSDICYNQNVTLTSELAEGTIRIVLTWGENPRDLDSHVVGTLSNGNSFHVYYGDKSQYDGDIEVCNLDVDDVTSYGPETITLNATTEYPYYYYIHRYAGTGTVATSSAQIKVYQGDRTLYTFNVPIDQGGNDYWNVFAIVNGNVIVKNTITSSPNTSYATSSRMRVAAYDFENEVLAEKEPYDEDMSEDNSTDIVAEDEEDNTAIEYDMTTGEENAIENDFELSYDDSEYELEQQEEYTDESRDGTEEIPNEEQIEESLEATSIFDYTSNESEILE